MEERKSVNVELSRVQAICLGFVNFDAGPEGQQLALDLTQRWNPLLFKAMVATRPSHIEISVVANPTLDGLVAKLKTHRDTKHPDCDLIVQSGGFEMLQRSTGVRSRIEVLLATFHKTQGDRVTVISAPGLDLSLVPSA